MPRAVSFDIEVPQADLDDLHARLRRTRWPADPGNPDGRYGAPRAWVADLVDHWAHAFDWRAVEARMNAYDQRLVELDGIPVHFLHAPGRGPRPMPLVLTHGWPWSFWDFERVVGPLSDPAAHGGDPADAFDVVVPSLPGFAFSVPLTTTGVDAARIAELWVRLMRDVLGHDRFGASGGDFGAIVTSQMGHAHADALTGILLTMATIPGVPFRAPPDAYAADERWMLDRFAATAGTTEAHAVVHMLDPQTLSYAMADSPAGLGAWLWHRRQCWSDADAVEVFGRGGLCTLASLYWFGGSFASAIRVYAEQLTKPPVLVHDRARVIDAPTGMSLFAKDIVFMPRALAERHADLRQWRVHESGGHFAPAEEPALMVDDLRDFFRPLR